MNALQRYAKKNPAITFRLPKAEKGKLEKIRQIEKRSMNNLIQLIVKTWLSKWE